MQIKLAYFRGAFVAGLLSVLAPGVGAAEDEAAAVPAASASQPADEESAPGSDKKGESTDKAVPADAVVGQMGEVSLEEFVPSEEIGADGAVSFPVDI